MREAVADANDRDVTPRWYEGLHRAHWIMLAVASAGWVFDVYEGQLFTIFKTPMLRRADRRRRPGRSTGRRISASRPSCWAERWAGCSSASSAIDLAGAGHGGDDPGLLGVLRTDRFAQTAWQVQVLRFLVALGTGGEWAVAAALVAETFPTRARAAASGIFHASSVSASAWHP